MIRLKDLTEEIALLLKDGFECEVVYYNGTIKMIFDKNTAFTVKVEENRNYT